MWDTMGELWIQTDIATTFWNDILCVLTLLTQKIHVVYGCSTYWTIALLLEMSFFYVTVGCEIWMLTYGSKHAPQSLSISHLCICTCTYCRCITWKLQVICGRSTYRMTGMLSETFFVWFRVAWGIQHLLFSNITLTSPDNTCRTPHQTNYPVQLIFWLQVTHLSVSSVILL